jgi:hypothetical protein
LSIRAITITAIPLRPWLIALSGLVSGAATAFLIR